MNEMQPHPLIAVDWDVKQKINILHVSVKVYLFFQCIPEYGKFLLNRGGSRISEKRGSFA